MGTHITCPPASLTPLSVPVHLSPLVAHIPMPTAQPTHPPPPHHSYGSILVSLRNEVLLLQRTTQSTDMHVIALADLGPGPPQPCHANCCTCLGGANSSSASLWRHIKALLDWMLPSEACPTPTHIQPACSQQPHRLFMYSCVVHLINPADGRNGARVAAQQHALSPRVLLQPQCFV
jgi:hypothetical protein